MSAVDDDQDRHPSFRPIKMQGTGRTLTEAVEVYDDHDRRLGFIIVSRTILGVWKMSTFTEVEAT